MKKSPRATRLPRQQALPFRAIKGRVDLWSSMTEQQQQDCRQVMRQLLVATVRHDRNAAHDNPDFPLHDLE
jgi:hypothetical protein